MSRRRTAKFENGNQPPQPPTEARKQAKVAAESQASSWHTLLTTSSSLFEFIGDLTSDEEIADLCATAIVSLTSSSASSLSERFQLVKMIGFKLNACSNANLLPNENENEERRKDRWTVTLALLSAQVNAAFAVGEEILIELAAIEDEASEEYSWKFSFYLRLLDGVLGNVVPLSIAIDEEGGWSYFDTFSVRFFKSIILTTDKRRHLLRKVLNNLFNHGAQNPPIGRYLSRETDASIECVTLLVDWLWLSFSQSSFDYCQAEKGEQMTNDQHYFLVDMKTALELFMLGTTNYQDGNKSPIVSKLIERAQQTLTTALNPSAASISLSTSDSTTSLSTESSSPFTSSSVTLSSPEVAMCTSLEFFDTIQSVRNVEMERSGVAQISPDEIAVTLPLILRFINSPLSSCSRPNRIAVFCLQTFTRVTLARDELVRLDYLKPILDTIVPLLLGQVDSVDAEYHTSVGDAFHYLIKSEESLISLADFPHEYIEIDSPKNLLRTLFQFVQLKMAKSNQKSLTESDIASVATCRVKYIKLLAAWCDSLIAAQREEAYEYHQEKKKYDRQQKEEHEQVGQEQIEQDQKIAREVRKKLCEEYQARLHANIAAGASEYMTIELLREMYDYFFQLASPSESDAQVGESLESFELRTSTLVLCARFMTDLITPISFKERISQLSARMIDLLYSMKSTQFTDIADLDLQTALNLHKSIFSYRISIHASLELLAGSHFNRPPEYVEAQAELILGVIDSDYDASFSLPIGDVAEEITRLKLLIDQERTAALRCLVRMAREWIKEELGNIPSRVTVALIANHHSYLVDSQTKAIEVASTLTTRWDLFNKGIDRILSEELSEFIMSARQFFFDIILHTPNRALAKLAFEKISNLINFYGQVVLTKGEVKLCVSPAPSVNLLISLPAEAAWQRVCSMFLTSRLPCQNTELRQECAKESTSYIHEEKLLPVPETLKEEDQEEIVDQCNEEEDEEPIEYADLMTAFFDLIQHLEYSLTPSHFLSSILVPILPALRRFHSRTWNHLIASTDFMQNMWHQLGEEMSPHRGSVLLILASCLMALKDRSHANVARMLELIQETAKNVLATKPDLDLNTILLDEEVRVNFVQMIA